MILTEEIENSLKNEAEIDDLLKQIHDMDFSEYIHHLFEKYHLKEADIIRKSGLERTYAYKIIRGEKGKNAKDKIYRLALAMNLTQKETNHLLSLNNAGDLYPHNARDLILLNGLLKKQTVEEVNIELYNHDLEQGSLKKKKLSVVIILSKDHSKKSYVFKLNFTKENGGFNE